MKTTTNSKATEALKVLKDELKKTVLGGAYKIASEKSEIGYVEVDFEFCGMKMKISVNEKGFICYHSNLFDGFMGEDEREFTERIMTEVKDYEKQSISNQIKELEEKLVKLN